MKTVIRKSVFETNSSSTHSLSLKNTNSNDENEEVSFEIRSMEAKIALLFGLAENAEAEYSSKFYYLDEDDSVFRLKNKILNEIKNTQNELLDGIDLNEITLYELSKLILKMNDSSVFDSDFFSDVEYEVSMLFLQEALDKKTVLKFKEVIVNEYSRLTGFTKEEALLEIDYAEFADTTLRGILKNEQTANEKLQEYLEKNSDFKIAYKNSNNKSLVEFAKQFFQNDYLEFKRLCEGKFHCDKYFGHGCLIECDCGFECYSSIVDSFNLDAYNDEQIQREAEKYLSDSVKITAEEHYCGLIFEKTGEIY